MSNADRLSDKDYLNYRNALTLALLSEEMRFALSEEEKKMGPDNWAWLFAGTYGSWPQLCNASIFAIKLFGKGESRY
ncbi:hypothetical protein ACO0LL_09550 [Undibacterium sp. TC4M20W]|uniref:hypothetical protein n=1 Tax=Undibacterium sp. TC4M20W TaxID=3413052 RepID=UPI003BF12A26